MSLVLGLDVSTTATKAVLQDSEGPCSPWGRRRTRTRRRTRFGANRTRPLVERHGGAVRAALEAAEADATAVEAVGLTGQMHGLVALDARDEVLRPAILWNDQRTGAECDAIREIVGRRRLIAITGNDALPGFTAPKLLWLRRHEPEVWASIAHVLLPKDLVRLRLTGEHAVDRADGSGTILFDLAARDWSPRSSTRSGSSRRGCRQPSRDRWSPARSPRPPRPRPGCVPGTPVIAGGGDQAAGAVGVGSVLPGSRRCRSAPPA